jgi:glutaredoxin
MLRPADGEIIGLKKGKVMHKKITVYTSSACPHCMISKKFLKNNNVAFENLGILSDPAKADEMVEKKRADRRSCY